MTLEPVSSSNLEAIGYDSPSETLAVRFKSGRTYQYFDVPERIHAKLMAAESKGRYLNREIKGMYRYARV